ncbi:tetratricopeptide repeat protein [Desulfatiglans anilini]|uniref:tetratricopeptide repeat protein n=1 Tax=Desulfatiglans anilini TaxID=90728 RepID=UPI000A01161D|nr:tetratricopeptide repeat protein [Desulfatiglans anilini]
MSSRASEMLILVTLGGFLLFLTSCATAPQPASRPATATVPRPAPEPAPTVKTPPPTPSRSSVDSVPLPRAAAAPKVDPRAVAALEITEEGRMLLKDGRTDEAITVLERALHLNPGNGRACYYLAEAWLVKGNKRQAKSFNRLAGIHLQKDREWRARVDAQRRRIER